jgi:hypothetical protein
LCLQGWSTPYQSTTTSWGPCLDLLSKYFSCLAW